MQWIWIAASWIALNIVVKLLVNSLERIHKDRIDAMVMATPLTMRTLAFDILRIAAIVVLSPQICAVQMFARTRPTRLLTFYREMNNVVLSRSTFQRYSPLMMYMLAHPLSIFSLVHHQRAMEWWSTQRENEAKLSIGQSESERHRRQLPGK
jgi:hypothetical protein